MASGTRGQATMAQRYSEALLALAEERAALDAVAEDLGNLRAMLDDSADLQSVVRSPVMRRGDQAQALDQIAQKAGFHQVTRNFLGLVASKRRLFAIRDMIDSYRAKLAERRGQITAEVIAAQPLTEAQISAITDQLKAAGGAQVDIRTRVDESLLGGLVVRLGSRMIDHSLRSKLARLQSAMKGVG